MNIFWILFLGTLGAALGGVIGSLTTMLIFFIWLKKQSKQFRNLEIFDNLEFDNINIRNGVEKLKENISSVGKFSNEQIDSMMNKFKTVNKKPVSKKKEVKENEIKDIKIAKDIDKEEEEEEEI